MSDSDKMRAEFEAWADHSGHSLKRGTSWRGEHYIYEDTDIAWQAWQAAYQAGRKAEQAEVERLREANQLLHAKVSSAGAENERLQTELAAAKAASRCPVRVLNIFECVCESDRYIELRTDAEADTFTDWLRDRIKDTPPTAT